jgi:hypothetical protein
MCHNNLGESKVIPRIGHQFECKERAKEGIRICP